MSRFRVLRSSFRFHASARASSQPNGRAAFSLIEVVLALAILAGAVAVLGEVSRNAMRNARIARDMTIAQLLCEGKMSEVVAGVLPVEPVVDAPVDTTDESSEPDWLYSIEIESIDEEEGLLMVRVHVRKDAPNEKRPVEFSITRWMLDSDTEAIVE